MVQDLSEKVKPKLLRQGGQQALSAKKISRQLEAVYEDAKKFKEANGLGGIRTAILANNFKWELKNVGYSDDFIKVAIEGLIISLRK